MRLLVVPHGNRPQQSLLRYNGMLISVFELIDEVKLRLQAELTQQQALLNFHLSDLKLQAVLAGVNVAGAGDALVSTTEGAASATKSASHNQE